MAKKKKPIEYDILKKAESVSVNNEIDWLNTFGNKLTSVAEYIRSLQKVISVA